MLSVVLQQSVSTKKKNEIVHDSQQSCLTANIAIENTIIQRERLLTVIWVFGHLILKRDVIFRTQYAE